MASALMVAYTVTVAGETVGSLGGFAHALPNTGKLLCPNVTHVLTTSCTLCDHVET
jgi:hypothetical protein